MCTDEQMQTGLTLCHAMCCRYEADNEWTRWRDTHLVEEPISETKHLGKRVEPRMKNWKKRYNMNHTENNSLFKLFPSILFYCY